MHLDVHLSARPLQADAIRDRTVVMIDVLRASTTICSALANGARAVIPAADPGEAGAMAAAVGSADVVIGGERDGVAIEGTRGNSPLAYTRDFVEGKTVILATTNGTPLLRQAAASAAVVVAGFVNAQAVVEHLRREGRDVAIVCAGWRGRTGLEDVLCAGLLLHRLWDGRCPDDATDEARLAFAYYETAGQDLAAAVAQSQHGRRLHALGADDDVAACAQLDTLGVVPVLDADGQLRPAKAA